MAVGFESATTDVCILDANVVTILAIGQCTIIASQDGNQNYKPAEDVRQTFSVLADSPGQHELYLPFMNR
jgi:hypothetical protein